MILSRGRKKEGGRQGLKSRSSAKRKRECGMAGVGDKVPQVGGDEVPRSGTETGRQDKRQKSQD